MDKKNLGVLVVLCASVLWAIEAIFVKLAYQKTDFLNIFAVRIIFSLLIIAIYVFLTAKKIFFVKRKYLPKLIYVSLVATLFADLLYIYALTKVPVVNAVLIGHMQPIFIILIGAFILRQDRITKFDYLGILFMILAATLVTTKNFANLRMFRLGSTGDLYVLGATIAWATTAIMARKYLKELSASLVAFYRIFFTALIFIPYMIMTKGIEIISIYQVLIGIVIGIGTILYYEGIRLIKAAQVSALELSTPFFASILGYLLLKEGLTSIQLIGMFLLGCGIYFLAKKEDIN